MVKFSVTAAHWSRQAPPCHGNMRETPDRRLVGRGLARHCNGGFPVWDRLGPLDSTPRLSS